MSFLFINDNLFKFMQLTELSYEHFMNSKSDR